MMGKDTKRTFFNFLPYECIAVEEYLEQMAEKGWLLQSVKGAFLRFKKIEPKKIKYSVDVLHKVSIFDHEDSEVALEYREYCQAAGWNYVCQKGKIQIFYTENYRETVSIHTDEEEKFKSVFKASLYNVGTQLFLIMVFIFNLWIQLSTGSIEFALTSNLGILSSVIMIFAIFINSIEVTSFFIWVIKARRKLKENKFMAYNNYKQLRIKNIFKKAFTLIMLSMLFSLSTFNNYGYREFNISSMIIFFIPIIVMIFVQEFINKKRYSKNTNMAIKIIGFIVSLYLLMTFIGVTVINGINKSEQNIVPAKKVSLTLLDFGFKANNDASPYIMFDKSILAQRIEYFDGSGENQLSYTTLQSQYPWVIKFYEKRLLNKLNKHETDLTVKNTNLPDNIKVYSDSKKGFFVLVSEDKVVDIRKDFNSISEDEFLDMAYKKLFK